MRITLIRHAETLANAAHIWQGQTDAALSEEGERQRSLLRERMRDAKYDFVICSDLGRTRTTAEALNAGATPDAMWREANVGAWEGNSQREIANLFPEQVRALMEGEDVRLGGTGESLGEFQARVAAAFESVAKKLTHENAHAAVVTHGGVISTLLLHLMGKKKRLGTRSLGRLMNTSMTTIELDACGRANVAVFNDSTHLGPTYGSELHSRIAILAASHDESAHAHHDAAKVFQSFESTRSHFPTKPTSIATLANSLLRCQPEHAGFVAPEVGRVSHLELVDGVVSLRDHGVVPPDEASQAAT